MEQITFTNILGNVIVTFIVLILVRVGKKYGTKTVQLISSINKAYSRRIHKEAAKGYTNKIVVVLFYLIVLFVIMISTLICCIVWDSSTTSNVDSSPVLDVVLSNSIAISIIILNVLLLEFYFRQSLINNNIADFNYKLKIIRPEISSETYNKLQQKWALMESDEDFKRIKNEIEQHLIIIESYKGGKK